MCYAYARTRLAYDEPIPPFNTRFPGKLEIALSGPSRQVGRELAHKGLSEQAEVLFYEMIKLHPFLNGNKRIACVGLMVFLAINSKWIRTSWKNLYNVAVETAMSSANKREKEVLLIKKFINKNVEDIQFKVKSKSISQ